MIAATVTAPAIVEGCPSWCTDHVQGDPGESLHWSKVTVGDHVIGVCEEAGGPAIITGECVRWWMHTPDARAYAASIIAVCDKLDAAT